MRGARIRSILIGPDLGFLGTCFLVGTFGGLAIGWFLNHAVPELLALPGPSLLAIPIAGAIAYSSGGLLSVWVALFPSLYMLGTLGRCPSYALCNSDFTGIFVSAVLSTIYLGTIGFLLGRATMWLQNDEWSLRELVRST